MLVPWVIYEAPLHCGCRSKECAYRADLLMSLSFSFRFTRSLGGCNVRAFLVFGQCFSQIIPL